MSYFDFRGLGADASAILDVGAQIQGKLPPIPGGLPLPDPSATLGQILASSPTASSIASDWGPVLGAVGNVPFDDITKSPGKAVDVMMTALPSVLDAAGIGGTAADIAA